MIGVNLIPPELLAARRRTRRIRLWAGIVAVVGAVAVVPVGWQINRRARIAELDHTKNARVAEANSVQVELDDVTQALADLNERIERAAALETKRPWANLMTMIAQAMPEELWLSSILTKTDTTRVATPRPARPDPNQAQASSVVVMDGATQLDLQGFALDHERLYDFMARLKDSRAFLRVDLVKANKEPVLWSQAVRFELTCTW